MSMNQLSDEEQSFSRAVAGKKPRWVLLTVLGMMLVSPTLQAADRVRIAIGTQDTTINCAAGGPLVRELKLLDKYLPHDGKYKDVTYDIQWESQPTGGQLNSKFLNNQLDIVQMADFPAIIGATAFRSTSPRYLAESVELATPSWCRRIHRCNHSPS